MSKQKKPVPSLPPIGDSEPLFSREELDDYAYHMRTHTSDMPEAPAKKPPSRDLPFKPYEMALPCDDDTKITIPEIKNVGIIGVIADGLERGFQDAMLKPALEIAKTPDEIGFGRQQSGRVLVAEIITLLMKSITEFVLDNPDAVQYGFSLSGYPYDIKASVLTVLKRKKWTAIMDDVDMVTLDLPLLPVLCELPSQQISAIRPL